MDKWIALLRGINVGGRTRMPMADLRGACTALGWENVATYIQSGNVIFEAESERRQLQAQLEQEIERHFGLSIPVIVRSGLEWRAYSAGSPFPEAALAEPNRLMLMLSKLTPADGAVAALRERAKDGERIEQRGDAIWVHYPGGAGTTKLSPSLIDRLVGSPTTSRNWRTVVKLQEMLSG